MTTIRAHTMPPKPGLAVGTLATIAAAVASPGVAQEPVRFSQPDPERFPPNTLVARLSIEPAVFEAVGNTSDLVAALREHLIVEASMPLDEPLNVIPRWNVHSAQSGNPFTIQTDRLGFQLEAGSAGSSDLTSAVRAFHESDTFSDWQEDEAWMWFLEQLEQVLAEPSMMMQMRPRERDESGHVRVRIAAVHSLPFGEEASALKESFERDYIELGPGISFSSSSSAGWEPPEGLVYDTRVLLFELETVSEAELVEAELPAITLSPDALDRFVGNYEIEPGVLFEVWREGDALVAAPRDDKTDRGTLTPFSETEFWTVVGNSRSIVRFEIGDDGAVTSMTLEQEGFSMTMQRVP